MNIPLSLSQYFSVGFALMVLARAIHYLAVTCYLRERGVAVARAGSSIHDWSELATYRKTRLSDHRSLVWWHVLWAIQIILFFWIAGWLANGVGGIKISSPTHLAQTAGAAGNYTTVFDVTLGGYRQWWFAASGLIFVAAGLGFPMLIRIEIIPKPSDWQRKWFPRVFVGFGIFWTLLTFAGTFIQYRRAVDALQNEEAKVVEGRVEHYRQGPKSESFDVQGIKFEYSDFVIIPGFNHMGSEGGPIREGLPVKIWYWRNEILRLQIREARNQARQPTPD